MQTKSEVAKELYLGLKKDTSRIKDITDSNKSINKLNEGLELISGTTFEKLGISEDLVKGLYSLGMDKPTHVQASCIPVIKSKKDCAFHSQSGTGKTIGFTAATLSLIKPGDGPQIIVITPTRELNFQVSGVISKLASFIKAKVLCTSSEFDASTITEEFVVGCPAKIFSLLTKKSIDASKIISIVLDEADHMISAKNFAVQTIRLLKLLNHSQKIFFSATYSEISQSGIKHVSPDCVKRFVENKKADNIKLYYTETKQPEKINTLAQLFEILQISSVIIFVGSKVMVEKCVSQLRKDNYAVSMIHGDVQNADRDKILEEFKSGATKYLITTDVFSRGMDIPQVNLIINFDLPYETYGNAKDTYIHRIGRSGRFNRVGFVIDFISNENDLNSMLKIHSTIGEHSELFSVPDLTQCLITEGEE